MKYRKKICVVTGTRAEYGLLNPLLHAIEQSDKLELQLIATGTHLEPEFGMTANQIEADGFTIAKRVNIELNSDTPEGVSISMSKALTGMAGAFAELLPDMLVLLGDRYEIFATAAAAAVAGIPIAHIHGGETTEGAIDEAFRHSISKMSYLHFTAAETYRRRVIQLGESPERVFNVGGLGVDVISRLKPMTKAELEQSIDFKLDKPFLLVTFHPATLDKVSSEVQFEQLLGALDEFPEIKVIFTGANADTDGKVINRKIREYVELHSERVVSFESLGYLRYLSAMKYAAAVVGNSSSGLLEAPSFKVPTVNIGSRQTGRVKADSVADCEPETGSISGALHRVLADEFHRVLDNTVNPYGTGGAADRILEILETCDIESVSKKFYDIDFNI